MRLLLLTGVNPAKVKTWVCQETSIVGSLIPPMDLCYIAAYVAMHGHDVEVVDLRLETDWRRNLADRVGSFRPDVAVTNLTTTSYLEDSDALRCVRRLRPATRIAAFGTHADGLPAETLADGLDAVLRGDPEASVLSFLEGRAEGVRTTLFKGGPAWLPSPDAVPFDGPRFIDLDSYRAAHHAGTGRFVPLMASRGCPYPCTYCLYPAQFGRAARYRSIPSMVDELEQLHRVYGVESVNYLDATFNLNRQRVLEFCTSLRSRALPIRFACNVRCDLLDEDVLAALARSGCRRLYLGVEDPELFQETQKHLKWAQVVRAFELVKSHDIETCAFMMLFPNGARNEDDYVRRMRRLIADLDPDAVQINVSIPFPGTADFERQRHSLSRDWSLYDPSGDRLPYACDLELGRIKRRLYRDFVFRNPHKVLRVVRQLPLREVGNLARQFWRHVIAPTTVA